MSRLQQKSIRILLGTLLVYGALVGTHEGEFWPFSIYPMFSSAGRPWSRVLVVRVPDDAMRAVLWERVAPADLPGPVYSLDDAGIAQNDLAAFVAQAETWGASDRQRLQYLFARTPEPHGTLLLYRVQGELDRQGKVAVTCLPVALISPQALVVRPPGSEDRGTRP